MERGEKPAEQYREGLLVPRPGVVGPAGLPARGVPTTAPAGAKFTKQLAAVLIVYPAASAEVTPEAVVLRPSRTHVPFKGLRELARE